MRSTFDAPFAIAFVKITASEETIERTKIHLKTELRSFNLSPQVENPTRPAALKTAEIVELLFNYGAKLNDKNTYNLTVLQITAAYCESVPVLQVILNHAKTEKLSLTEPFVTALKTERPVDIVRQFINFIPNINKSVSGKTPLMYAAENYEATDVIKLLLENGADPYIISTENKNAFSYAKENSKIKHDSIYWSLNVSASRKR